MTLQQYAALVSTLSKPVETLSAQEVKQEIEALEQFALDNEKNYEFSKDAAQLSGVLQPIFFGVVERRMKASAWSQSLTGEHRYLCLIVVRELSRDDHFQTALVSSNVLPGLGEYALDAAGKFVAAAEEGACCGECLVEASAIARRLVDQPQHVAAVLATSLLDALLVLLRSSDSALLTQVLMSLEGFATHRECLATLFTLDAIDSMLHILANFPAEYKLLVLRLLVSGARDVSVRDTLLASGVVTYVVNLLSSAEQAADSLVLMLNLLRKLMESRQGTSELVQVGGTALLVSLLDTVPPPLGEQLQNNHVAMLQLLCSILKVLAEDADVACQIRAANGVYHLGKLLRRPMEGLPQNQAEVLRLFVLRVMRYIFSVERNRVSFKRLFPPEVYALFIDVGNYENDPRKYLRVWRRLVGMSDAQLAAMDAALDGINRANGEEGLGRIVKNYVLLEELGKGAFGAVYMARQLDAGERLVALKELEVNEVTVFGATAAERKSGMGRVAQEVAILSSLSHPNIVKYYESFEADEHLWIVMELVEGESLMHYLTLLAEKRKTRKDACMVESEVWTIFSQLVQALNYIHNEKGIVHRDITPSNVVLGRSHDGVPVAKLADFGLAKQQTENSVMQSMVGTMTYTCPEIVKNCSYNEKADVWSLGCLLYHMLMGRPPFEGSNMLTLAQKIVEGKYAPVADPVHPAAPYSSLLKSLVPRLLEPEPLRRPSVSEVAAMISTQLLKQLDRAAMSQEKLVQSLDHMKRKEAAASCARTRWDFQFLALPSLNARDGGAHPVSTFDTPTGALPPITESPAHLRDGVTVNTPNGASTPTGRVSTPGSPAAIHPGASLGSHAGRTIQVARSRLRPVLDPCARLLSQLHKVEWLSQLPPAAEEGMKRRAIERFRRSLFGPNTNPGYVKSQLVKLQSASTEVCDAWAQSNAFNPLTYEALYRMIEELLVQNGYHANAW